MVKTLTITLKILQLILKLKVQGIITLLDIDVKQFFIFVFYLKQFYLSIILNKKVKIFVIFI